MLHSLLLLGILHLSAGLRYIEVGNKNSFPIWIQTRTNALGTQLKNKLVRLDPGARTKYDISNEGWAGRMWPKIGCDESGNNCTFGQSEPPCPSNGCQPPADTKVEFFMPPTGDPRKSYYDISLVDGFTYPSEIIPFKDGVPVNEGACIRTDCKLNLDQCPVAEKNNLGSLKVDIDGRTVACLSPCKKFTYPPPYGEGKNEQEGDGRLLCCPAPVSVEECRKGIVVQTEFVELVRRICPTAYSYSYDDEGGLHDCPSDVSYVVNFYS